MSKDISFWRDIWSTIESDHTSTSRDRSGHRVIHDALHFKGMSDRRQQRVIDAVANQQKDTIQKKSGSAICSLSDVHKSCEGVKAAILSINSGKPLLQRVKDTSMNLATMSNVPGQDPGTMTLTTPNFWLDPGEAAAIYGQGGIPSLIVRKKSQSIVLNGARIKNPRLTPEQLDKVNESAMRTGLSHHLADGTRDGLVYSGSLLFPFFKKDSPITMGMSIADLMRLDVIGKDCIERYVELDKWNTVHIPNWNPTASDFKFPKYYYIPFLGADVNAQRSARIVPLPQAGYWGTIMTMGWGAPDITSWYPAYCKYEQIMSAIPTMIEQMSMLVRSYNVDMTNAMNGANSLREMDDDDTMRIRQSSINNPIFMDIIGDLKAIDRDFAQVPELTRLTRQDVASKAGIPEELFWSSERGAFSSGDQTEGALERQWESVKYIHRDVAYQCRSIAMLEIINALGKDYDVIKALPYTTIEFDNPITANAESKSKIIANLAQAVFDLRASGVPTDIALEIVAPYGDDHYATRSDVMKRVGEIQAAEDAKNKEEHDKNMEMLTVQIENAKKGVTAAGAGPATPAKKSSGYTRLEQHEKEKTRGPGARKEGLQKAQGKKV